MSQISLITTVLNEGESIKPLLDSIVVQTMMPNEIVICDGGSTDNTVKIIESYIGRLPIRLIIENGANISEGRNIAIRNAVGDIICATDAGVRLSPNWVEQISRPILFDNKQVVSGWFESDPQTSFEAVMGATVLPNRNEINPNTFLPSSRSVAFTKQAWEDVGGYPEWLDYGEDLVYDFALKERYGKFGYAPRAVAYFRPRSNMKSFAKQYYLYARGDGKADLWQTRHLIRYIIYLIVLPFLLIAITNKKLYGYILLILGGFAYCALPIQRFLRATSTWSPLQRIPTLFQIPLIRAVGDIAKMIGYPVGVVWRKKNRPKQD